jgi:hypothetical protein
MALNLLPGSSRPRPRAARKEAEMGKEVYQFLVTAKTYWSKEAVQEAIADALAHALEDGTILRTQDGKDCTTVFTVAPVAGNLLTTTIKKGS